MHLIKTLKEHYKVEEDWGGKWCLQIAMDWDIKKREVHMSMLVYVERALAQFGHPIPMTPQHELHQHAIPTHGATVQYSKPDDTLKRLSPAKKKNTQEVISIFLYYRRSVDFTMLTELSAIASAQAKSTEDTMMRCKQFLDYAATHQDAIIMYKKSDMVLVIHSDAFYFYLSEPNARSHAGRHFFMSSNIDNPINNGAVLNLAQLTKAVMSSTAEAELGALYINAREAIPQQQPLEEMGHNQPPTPMQTNNTATLGPWRCEQQHSTSMHQSHGHAIPLAQMPRSPRSIPIFSGTLDPPTRLTAGPRITAQHTTLKKDTNSFCNTVYWKPFALH